MMTAIDAQRGKRHLKINGYAILTILQLSHLARILQCWLKNATTGLVCTPVN